MESKTAFVLMLLSYVFYAHWYWGWNAPGDKYQLHFLVAAVMIGLLPQPFLGVGPLIGIFCVMPRAILSSLVFSDLIHVALKRKAGSILRAVADDDVSGEKV
jgi:hypothetical protein